MDNGRLLHDAWRLTWRHRFLWVLGLFAGGGSHFTINVPSGPCEAAVDLTSAVLAASVICETNLTLALWLPAERARC